jgi:hypothetical protein
MLLLFPANLLVLLLFCSIFEIIASQSGLVNERLPEISGVILCPIGQMCEV